MQECAKWEVEFQLDLCGGDILYQDLLKHLSITFQGGEFSLFQGSSSFESCLRYNIWFSFFLF